MKENEEDEKRDRRNWEERKERYKKRTRTRTRTRRGNVPMEVCSVVHEYLAQSSYPNETIQTVSR